ncbi:DUF883 family protein [Candidatus Methylacidithermus pantelleriae]|uniref:DUF883 domain-containing protein n=1 Tax=Candidatus Methylacidithermus pantelleriae TaxID=2744239 RepID=A0A8J2BKK5_9BACT|nr:DUF883 family protein [Candidatus Methylacidithermus pantelleriae]CAF0689771.1 conserved hypothetical protein [Candidatus Methylacidithermus pantelleriae]
MDGAVNREKLFSDLRALVEDARSLVKASTEEVKEKTRDAWDRMRQGAEKIREYWSGAEETLTQKTLETAKQTDKTIRERPYESLVVAFLAGLLLGIVVARK